MIVREWWAPRPAWALALALVAVTMTACRRAGQDQGEVQAVSQDSITTPAAPRAASLRIDAIVPDSFRMSTNTMVELSIRGAFHPAGRGLHTVSIGPVVLDGVPANAAGTEIRVVVPQRFSSGGEAPPRPLFPGEYDVRVASGADSSNTLVVRVLP